MLFFQTLLLLVCCLLLLSTLPLPTRDRRIEKIWYTSGYLAVVTSNKLGFRCGYVGIPKSHPLYQRRYQDGPEDQLDVHGGITFSGRLLFSARKLWWFGYDCGHYQDALDASIYEGPPAVFDAMSRAFQGGTIRTRQYCIDQCEYLALQLRELT